MDENILTIISPGGEKKSFTKQDMINPDNLNSLSHLSSMKELEEPTIFKFYLNNRLLKKLIKSWWGGYQNEEVFTVFFHGSDKKPNISFMNFIHLIYNQNDLPIILMIGREDILIPSHKALKLDLPIEYLVFTDKKVEIPIDIFEKKMEWKTVGEVYDILWELFSNEYEFGESCHTKIIDLWKKMATEFVIANPAICLDYPTNSKVGPDVPPAITGKLSIPNEGVENLSEWCQLNQEELKKDCGCINGSVKIRHINRIRIDCPDGRKCCQALHWRIEYYLDEELLEIHRKINNNTISYNELQGKWDIFHKKIVKEQFDLFFNESVGTHIKDGKILFPVYSIEQLLFSIIGDGRREGYQSGKIDEIKINGVLYMMGDGLFEKA